MDFGRVIVKIAALIQGAGHSDVPTVCPDQGSGQAEAEPCSGWDRFRSQR